MSDSDSDGELVMETKCCVDSDGVVIHENRVVREEIKDKKDNKRKTCKHDRNISFYTTGTFIFFCIFWILLCVVCGFYKCPLAFILFLPLVYFSIGMCNADRICTREIEDDVFQTTFINTGLILTLQLLSMRYDDKISKTVEGEISLTKTMYVCMILILFTYPHIWTSVQHRHIVKIARSCLETMSVTIFIFIAAHFLLPDEIGN